MRHLNKDQKAIFYSYVYENNENVSLLSLEEKKGLFRFVREAWDFVERGFDEDDRTDISDRLYSLKCRLDIDLRDLTKEDVTKADKKGKLPVTACNFCGWINGHSDHKDFPFKEQFENNPEICPVCGRPTYVKSM